MFSGLSQYRRASARCAEVPTGAYRYPVGRAAIPCRAVGGQRPAAQVPRANAQAFLQRPAMARHHVRCAQVGAVRQVRLGGNKLPFLSPHDALAARPRPRTDDNPMRTTSSSSTSRATWTRLRLSGLLILLLPGKRWHIEPPVSRRKSR